MLYTIRVCVLNVCTECWEVSVQGRTCLPCTARSHSERSTVYCKVSTLMYTDAKACVTVETFPPVLWRCWLGSRKDQGYDWLVEIRLELDATDLCMFHSYRWLFTTVSPPSSQWSLQCLLPLRSLQKNFDWLIDWLTAIKPRTVWHCWLTGCYMNVVMS